MGRTAYVSVPDELARALAACASGIELSQSGFGADVDVAAELDVSDVVPVLTDGWFVPAE